MRSTPEPAHREAARALLENMRLREPELERHFECALSPQYWRALVPDLTVGGEPARGIPSSPVLDPDSRAGLLTLFGREGVIEAPPIAHDTLTARMRAGVQALARADWPPVFSWIYDEFWQVPRAAPLVDLFTGILGAGYRQTRYIWTHLVPGRRGAAGWRPHVDYAGADFRLTVWIALSDVTADSGCICVIPRHLVPERVVGRWYELTTLEKPDVMDILHASRPLPVRAGGVLAWDAGLMHWGSTRQSPGEPRVSFVMEFAPATTDAAVTGPTLPADGPDLPTHAERLAMIARAIRLYHPSETRAIRYTGLSDRLLERFQQA